eukprot:m.2399 g.2399  ORF g.2399 m.2399 type:complete len:101 (-) comp1776_c0_seq2:76-378(-)
MNGEEEDPSVLKARALEACQEYKDMVVNCFSHPFQSVKYLFCAEEIKQFLECYKKQRGSVKAKVFGKTVDVGDLLDVEDDGTNTVNSMNSSNGEETTTNS